MQSVGLDQWLTAAVFLAALGVVWLLVQRNRHQLARRIAASRRMRVLEVVALAGDTRAVLLDIDGREHLVVCHRRGSPAIAPLPLGSVAEVEEAAE